LLWPPSQKSAPSLLLLVLSFAELIRRTFFSPVETQESRQVRETKRRLVLAQMSQALRWDKAEFDEQSAKDKRKRRPPPSADLFDMVYDEVEERHVTDYNKRDCHDRQVFQEHYLGTLALFKERLVTDMEECVAMTNLARQ
jgi:hypothetical protein